jgi:hypothetical protein
VQLAKYARHKEAAEKRRDEKEARCNRAGGRRSGGAFAARVTRRPTGSSRAFAVYTSLARVIFVGAAALPAFVAVIADASKLPPA